MEKEFLKWINQIVEKNIYPHIIIDEVHNGGYNVKDELPFTRADFQGNKILSRVIFSSDGELHIETINIATEKAGLIIMPFDNAEDAIDFVKLIISIF